MATSNVDKSQLERPYVFFLFKALSNIYQVWIEGDELYALSQACKLVIFLPNDVKETLWHDKEAIQKDMRIARGKTATNFYTTNIVRNRNAKEVATKYLEAFMDKIVRLLDEKGWLERGAMRPRYPGAKKLSVETIEAH